MAIETVDVFFIKSGESFHAYVKLQEGNGGLHSRIHFWLDMYGVFLSEYVILFLHEQDMYDW